MNATRLARVTAFAFALGRRTRARTATACNRRFVQPCQTDDPSIRQGDDMIAARKTRAAGRSLSRLARTGLLGLALVAATAFGVIASGCSSSSSGGVAQVGTDTTTTDGSTSPSGSGDPAAYAACMRRNGVPNFPDPEGDNVRIDKGLEDSPQFEAGDNACKSLRPGGRVSQPSPQQRAEAQRLGLRHAACMRENGVPNFPDPVVMADGRFDFPTGIHVDEDSPRYRAAAQACRGLGRGAKGAVGGPSGGGGSRS